MKLHNSNFILIRQLDKKFRQAKAFTTETPTNGWINAIRTALNMSLEQFGNRLSITGQGAKRLEKREADESITLKGLREAGNALDMKLVYGFVPKGLSLEAMIEEKARQLAVKIVKRTSVSMKLEDQENSKERIEEAINEMAQQIKREVPKSLWD
jgi:predicted DNA-binding mobile mystery protein A